MPCWWTSARINGGFRSPAASSPSCNIPQPGARTLVPPACTYALVPVESADGHDVFRLGSLLALGDVELDLLSFLQAAITVAGDRTEVHEHVLATLDRDETVTLVGIEPLHSALSHVSSPDATLFGSRVRGTRSVRPPAHPASARDAHGARCQISQAL